MSIMVFIHKHSTQKLSNLGGIVVITLSLAMIYLVKRHMHRIENVFTTVYVRPFAPFQMGVPDGKSTYPLGVRRSLNLSISKGNEEAQMNVFWSILFNDRRAPTAQDVILHYHHANFGSAAVAFMKKSKEWPVPQLSDFRHVWNQTYNGTHVCVAITEHLYGKLTIGGSNFILAVRGSYSIDVARSLDYFNGTYQVCARYYELDIYVILTCYYYHFGAFRLEKTANDTSSRLISERILLSKENPKKVLFRSLIIEPKNMNVTIKHAYSRLSSNAFNLSTKGNVRIDSLQEKYATRSVVFDILANGAWVMYRGHWRILYSNAIVARSPPQRTQQCLTKFDSVTFAGDSHLRYLYYYMVSFVTKPDPTWGMKVQFHLRTERFSFWWKAKGTAFNIYLEDLHSSLLHGTWEGFSHPKRGGGHLLVMSMGHHDLELPGMVDTRVGPGLYLENMKRSLIILQDIVSLAKSMSISLLWIAHPPFPNSYSFQANFRNNVVLAALNQWFVPKISLLGIPVLNLFDQTFILNDLDRCSSHYLCVEPATGKADGDAGIVMADLLLSLICPDKN